MVWYGMVWYGMVWYGMQERWWSINTICPPPPPPPPPSPSALSPQIYITSDDVLQQDYYAQKTDEEPELAKRTQALKYTGWSGPVGRKWHGKFRILWFWITYPLLLIIIALALAVPYSEKYDLLYSDPWKSSEVSRSVMAGLICIFDIVIPVQVPPPIAIAFALCRAGPVFLPTDVALGQRT